MVCALFTLTACPDSSEFDISDGSQPPVTASKKKLKSMTITMPRSSIKTTVNYTYDKAKRVSTIYYHYPSQSDYHLTINFLWDSHKIHVEDRYGTKNRSSLVYKFNLNKLGFITEIVPLPDESSKNPYYDNDYIDWSYKYEYNGNYLSSITIHTKFEYKDYIEQGSILYRFENNEKENFTRYGDYNTFDSQGEITDQSYKSRTEYSCSPIENIGNISYMYLEEHISPLLYFSDARYTTGYTENAEICNLLQIATGLFGKINKYIITTSDRYHISGPVSCEYTHDNDNYITSIRALHGDQYVDKSISLIWE